MDQGKLEVRAHHVALALAQHAVACSFCRPAGPFACSPSRLLTITRSHVVISLPPYAAGRYLLIGVGCFIVLLIGMRLTYRRRKVKVELTNDQEPLLGGSRPIVGGAPPLGSRPWLHGSLSKHAAEKILASAGCDGAFLLRSGKHGSYYLSVFADRRPQHFHLIRDERDGQLYVQFHQTVKFRDLDVLVSQVRRGVLRESGSPTPHRVAIPLPPR